MRGFSSAATAGLSNGLGLLLEQLRILAAAQSTKLSPEKFLKLASDGNDKLVLQMVKGEPNLVSYDPLTIFKNLCWKIIIQIIEK